MMIRCFKCTQRLKFISHFIIKSENVMREIRPCVNILNENCYGLNHFHSSSLFMSKATFLPTVRFKHYKKSKYQKEAIEDEESDSESEDEEFDENDRGVKTYTSSSIRLDMIVKKALGLSRKNVEEHFYENKLRINGNLILKKSVDVKIGDEIDLIKNFSTENPNFIVVDRFEIIKIKKDVEKEVFLLKIRLLKSLLIENYDGKHKWVQQVEPSES